MWKSYFINSPWWLQRIFPKRLWHKSREEKKVYLTFDDGPIPNVTPWVLKQLERHEAKATFFCIGDNIKKHPEVFQQIIREGHVIGNHTQNHLNGWKTANKTYIQNVHDCGSSINELFLSSETSLRKENQSIKLQSSSLLFRPPYGKLKSNQAKQLISTGYKIVMWDVLSTDFDQDVSAEKCLENVLNNIQNGSIVVFHDSLKAERNLRYALPRILDYLSKNGFVLEPL